MKCKPQDMIAHNQEITPLLNKLANPKLEDVNLDQLLTSEAETLTLKQVFILFLIR